MNCQKIEGKGNSEEDKIMHMLWNLLDQPNFLKINSLLHNYDMPSFLFCPLM